MDDREQIRQRFNRGFASWEIVLPVDAMSPGVVWFIVSAGMDYLDAVRCRR